MEIRHDELQRRLQADDDGIVINTLRELFVRVPRIATPLVYDWLPAPNLDIVLGDQAGGDLYDFVSRGVIDLANAAEAALRERRFRQTRAEHPDWPVVVCEGDSWISHPLVADLGDQLVDAALPGVAVLNRGAAGDLLGTMAREREYAVALAEVEARALLLSGGGNDLLLTFGEFLRPGPHAASCEPAALVSAAFERRMTELMEQMRSLLLDIRRCDAELPIVVHGYDYLRVEERGRGMFLAPHFDVAGIDEPGLRQSTLDHIVDRYNDHLARTLEGLPLVTYADLRGTVPNEEWFDEIHPDDRGFRRLGPRIAAALRRRMR